MPHRLFCLAALLAAAVALAVSARPDDKDKKAVELFNGKNLDGWKFVPIGKGDTKADATKTWTVDEKEKALVCNGEPWGYLITEKEYGDYKLEFEWRWPKGDPKAKKLPNSGVLIHCKEQEKGKTWPSCFEAQLLSGKAGEIWLMGCKVEGKEELKDSKAGGHWFRMKTDKEVEKPLGEWNKYEIVCNGDAVTLAINGQKVNEATKAERTKGKIAFQAEGFEIHLRGLRLTPLK